MLLLPAIDIRSGRCVRLIQGDYDQETVYSDSPVEMAKTWEREGARYLHIVDLDGAKTGAAVNKDLIGEIVSNVSIPIQVGGGIRTTDQLKAYADAGVWRMILGTAALEDIDFLKRALQTYGSQIAVSIDARNDYVATDGWTETSEIKAVDFIQQLSDLGVQTVIYTDIAKDGMQEGPNVSELNNIQQTSSINLIASGGITSEEDIRTLRRMHLYGAVIGKALYDGTTTFKRLLEVS